MAHSGSTATQTSPPLIEIQNLHFRYQTAQASDTAWSLQVPSLSVQAGSFLSLTGPNMSGKSTLLRIIGGHQDLRDADAETLRGTLMTAARSRFLGLSHQPRDGSCLLSHEDPMFPELSLWDNVRLARPARARLSTSAAQQSFSAFLATIPILKGRSLREPLGSLSSGGKSLIRLARAFIWSATLLLIDEVTAHLDKDNSTLFLSALVPFVTKGGTVILVSHLERDHLAAEQLMTSNHGVYLRLTLSAEGAYTCLREA